MAVCTHKMLIELSVAAKLQCIPNTGTAIAHLPKVFSYTCNEQLPTSVFKLHYHTFPSRLPGLLLRYYLQQLHILPVCVRKCCSFGFSVVN